MEEDKVNADFIVIAILILILFSWMVSTRSESEVVEAEESWYDKAERRYLKKEEE